MEAYVGSITYTSRPCKGVSLSHFGGQLTIRTKTPQKAKLQFPFQTFVYLDEILNIEPITVQALNAIKEKYKRFNESIFQFVGELSDSTRYKVIEHGKMQPYIIVKTKLNDTYRYGFLSTLKKNPGLHTVLAIDEETLYKIADYVYANYRGRMV